LNGDQTQLQSALMNLSVNARDAMPHGGTLTFSTDTVVVNDQAAANKAYKMVGGTFIKITVADTGAGMDANTRAHAFEPFYTTKQKGRGTGLGLASVYGTVKRHGGYIELYSEPGAGTRFEILLPLAVIGDASTSDAGSGAAPQHGKGRILVVDDETMIRDVASEMLTGIGYTVASCSDGAEAVRYYQQHSAEVDLVILDMIMPGLNGRECFSEMKKIRPDVRALIVSGYAVDGDAEKTLRDGAIQFLRKPFTTAILAAAVAEALGA
jgi:CheY-like chemotaxis protein